MNKSYAGIRDQRGKCHVHVIYEGDSHALAPRLDLVNHSPTGFEWGYGGSGPAQLALAILADALGDDGRAMRLHQLFKARAIATLPRHTDWEFTHDEVMAIVAVMTPARETTT